MSQRVFYSQIERIRETLHPSDHGYSAEPLEIADARWLLAVNTELMEAARAALNDRMYKDWPGVADLLIAAIAKAQGHL